MHLGAFELKLEAKFLFPQKVFDSGFKKGVDFWKVSIVGKLLFLESFYFWKGVVLGKKYFWEGS